MKVSVVVPCYKSAAALPELVARIDGALGARHDLGLGDWEIILVVDGSPDNTADVARDLARSNVHVRLIEFRRNYGQHNALLAGIRAAAFDVVVTIDDDLQHPPEQIGILLDAMEDPSVDLAYGIPEVEEHGFFRSLASRAVKGMLSSAGVSNARWVGAFRVFRTDLRDGFAAVTDSHVNIDVLLSWTTTSVRAVTVAMDKRHEGQSGYSARKLIRHALNMVTGYGVAPLKLATWLGFACGLLGLALLGVVIVRYVLGEITVAGYTTTIALIALFSGAQMVSIGIIGEYLGRQHFRTMNKPTYLIRDDLKGTK